MSLCRSPQLIVVAKAVARELRRRQTSSERMFWEAVRNRRFLGRKFLRQHPLLVDNMGRETFFVADFYCAESRLIVEIDGKMHDKQKGRDALRTAVISERGLRVVRFKNDEIEKNLEEVLEKLRTYL